jgi:hypothetical protein
MVNADPRDHTQRTTPQALRLILVSPFVNRELVPLLADSDVPLAPKEQRDIEEHAAKGCTEYPKVGCEDAVRRIFISYPTPKLAAMALDWKN